MANATIINKFGKLQGWNSLTANVLGRDLEGITMLSYDDDEDISNAYGAGKYPIGRSDGNYTTEPVKIGLYKEEMDLLDASMAPGMRIQEIPPFPIIAEYERPGGAVSKDIIHNFQFKKRGRAVQQGDGSIVYECEGICSHIEWGR